MNEIILQEPYLIYECLPVAGCLCQASVHVDCYA